MSADAPARQALGGRSIARVAAVLVVARPVGALAFTAGLLLLPRWAASPVVDDVTWAFFGYLFLTSILNLGLERLVGPWAGRHPQTPLRHLIAPVLTARLASFPLVVAALWALLSIVRVDLGLVAFAWTSVWIAAGQVGTLVYAVVRVDGRTVVESGSSVAVRVAQGSAILLGGMAGWSAGALVGSMAVLEIGMAGGLLALVRLRPSVRAGDVASLPWRELAGFTALEIVGFVYLRTDTLLVGRLMDATAGATYTLLYRVIDAAVAIVTPLVMVLYPQAALRSAAGQSLERFRKIGLGLVPAAAVLAAAAGALAAQPLLDQIPRYSEHAVVLRCLLAAVPLMTWNAIELHLRAAEGATRAVLRVGVITLVVAVAVSVPLIDHWGLRGAALGVFVAEALQVVVLAWRVDPADRASAIWVLSASMALCVAGWFAPDVSLWWVGPVAVLGLGARRAATFAGELR